MHMCANPCALQAAAARAAGGVGASGPSGARRLFDKEADNPHEEPALGAQLAAGALRGLLMGRGVAAVGPGGGQAADGGNAGGEEERGAWERELGAWCGDAAERLRQVAEAVAASSGGRGGGEQGAGGVEWLGGFVNHPDVFACAYGALLALWATEAVWARGAGERAGPGGVAEVVRGAVGLLVGEGEVHGSQLMALLEAVGVEAGAGTEGERKRELERRILFLL